jgi:2-dehydro-3-deoxyphosphogalactonate aldolase
MLSDALLSELPLVAILRGVTPERIEAIADLLVGEGFRAIEVPLNSPEPFKSIEMLARRFGARCLTGAGTVTTPSDVDRVADAGGTLIVSPHTDVAVVARTVEKKLFPMPGVLTPSECYAAIGAGARHLKLFPASTVGIGHLKAIKAVLPKDVNIYAVGGVNPSNMAEWRAAGVTGFGLGSDLFKPDFSDAEIGKRARAAVAAFRA